MAAEAQGTTVEKEMKVMVAVDESECSQYALEWALDHLKDSFSSPLLLYTVQSISNIAFIPAAYYGTPPPELMQSVQEHQRKGSLALLEMAKQICADRGVAAETITELGEPKEAICDAVDKYGIKLLVLGSHGRAAFQRAFLGSVSNFCLHNAKCPVLIVKKQG